MEIIDFIYTYNNIYLRSLRGQIVFDWEKGSQLP